MENGTRVSDIKKKFEKLNIKKSGHKDKANTIIVSKDLIPSSINSKNIIRRSNAFRTDKINKSSEEVRKSHLPSTSTSESLYQNFNIKSGIGASSNFVPKSYTISAVSNNLHHKPKEDPKLVNRILSYTKPSDKHRELGKHIITVSGFSQPSSYLVTKKVSNSPTLSSASPTSNKSSSSQYSIDTLKKVLNSPLPVGPPPKKPPRTFQYGFQTSAENLPPLVYTRVKPFLKPTLSNESPAAPTAVTNRVFPYLQRSKTEPHISLSRNTEPKNINITTGNIDLIKRQLTQTLANENRKSSPINSVFPHSILRSFNCVSDRNSNIYDVPFIPNKHNTVVGHSSGNRQFVDSNNIFRKYEELNNHPYYEPYSPRTKRKSYLNVSPHLDAMNLSNSSVPKENLNSLHYHSSPVRNSVDQTTDSTILHPDNFEGNRVFLERILNDAFGESEPTLPRGTDSDTDSGSSYIDEPLTSVSAEKLIAERKGYLQRVVSLRNPPLPTMSLPPRPNNSFKLFESVLLISITPDVDRGCIPFIKATYYDSNMAIPALLEELCFPDASLWPPSPHTHNNYRVVMTNAEGERKYAYCRRLQPEGTPFWIPLAYCIITSHNAPGFYYKVLAEIETRHGLPETKFSQFVQALSESSLPPPGVPLKISRTVGEFSVMRPEDPRLEDKDLLNLINYISVPTFLKLLSTILLERKAILIGSNVSKLSECIEGLEKALYPFIWQHTLVTTVPKSMHDLCQAPTPYIVGLLRQNLDVFSFSDIGQMFAVDVDRCQIINQVGDEDTILPGRFLKGLKTTLSVALSTHNNYLASEALIRMFVELVGHFSQHIVSLDSGARTFQKVNFVKSVHSESLRLFLEWFSETAMFSEFLDKRLHRSCKAGLFEVKCSEITEKKAKMGTKKGLKFKHVKQLGDRLIDKMKLS